MCPLILNWSLRKSLSCLDFSSSNSFFQSKSYVHYQISHLKKHTMKIKKSTQSCAFLCEDFDGGDNSNWNKIILNDSSTEEFSATSGLHVQFNSMGLLRPTFNQCNSFHTFIPPWSTIMPSFDFIKPLLALELKVNKTNLWLIKRQLTFSLQAIYQVLL